MSNYTWDNGVWSNGELVSITDSVMDINPRFKFFIDNSGIEWRNFETCYQLMRAYIQCAPLSSIINSKAKSFSGGTLEVLNANTLKYVRGTYKEWENLLNNPNPLQTKYSFFRQLYTYMSINGWTLMMKVYPSGFRDRPSKLWNLPFWCLEIDQRTKPYHQLEKEDLLSGIYFSFNGVRTPLNPDDLILITDDTGIYDPNTWLPRSRIYLQRNSITTLLSGDEAEITLIQKKGALGILSNKSGDTNGHIPIGTDEREALERDFTRYGLSRNQWQYIITNANLEWQAMSFPAKELQLQESDVKAVKRLCDAMNHYYELTAYSDRKNLSNVNSFDRMQYQNHIIPEADAIMSQITKGLVSDLPIIMRMDYSTAPALQQSEEAKGKGQKALNDALQIEWDNGLITRNDWLVAIGKDKVLKPEFDKYKWELDAETQQNTENNQVNSNNSE